MQSSGEMKYCRYRERGENIYVQQSQILNQIYFQEISMNLKFCTARAGSCPVTFKENFLSKVLNWDFQVMHLPEEMFAKKHAVRLRL